MKKSIFFLAVILVAFILGFQLKVETFYIETPSDNFLFMENPVPISMALLLWILLAAASTASVLSSKNAEKIEWHQWASHLFFTILTAILFKEPFISITTIILIVISMGHVIVNVVLKKEALE